jgi:hypothetical protein
MSVSSINQLYSEHETEWKIVRDTIAGELQIKRCGDYYLPRPGGHSNEDYKHYQQRVHFFSAVGRTAEGLHGSIFCRLPELVGITLPEAAQVYIDDVDGIGTSLNQFAADACWDAIQTTWGGILIDYSRVADDISLAEAERIGARAYMRWYPAESVINWQYRNSNGRLQLALVVLHELVDVPTPDDPFVVISQDRYRVLRLDDLGQYVVDIYDTVNGGLTITESIVPRARGKALSTIPFIPCPVANPEKSMLLDIAFENIGHYQKTADYENGIHYAGTPTPVVCGAKQPVDKNGDIIPLQLGGSTFLFINDPDPDKIPTVQYLETTGAGNGQILAALQACEEKMAILGARIISAEKRGVESAEAARIHRIGENGVLGAFAQNMSERITTAMQLMLWWNGIDAADLSYHLNTDYDLSKVTETMLNIIMNGRNTGDVPRQSVYSLLKKADLLPAEMTYEQYLEEIELPDDDTEADSDFPLL